MGLETVTVPATPEVVYALPLSVAPDVQGNPSINSGFIGGRVSGGGLGANIGANCVECAPSMAPGMVAAAKISPDLISTLLSL